MGYLLVIKIMDTVETPTVGACCIPAQKHRQGEVCFGISTSRESAPHQVSARTGIPETAPPATVAAPSIAVSVCTRSLNLEQGKKWVPEVLTLSARIL